MTESHFDSLGLWLLLMLLMMLPWILEMSGILG